MTIRRVQAGSLDDLLQLVHEYYEAVGVLERDIGISLREDVISGEAAAWIAYESNVPAGCVLLRPLAHIPAAGECKRLYVRPAFRKRGVADLLMAELERHARETGVACIYLDSKDDMTAALSLYRRLGYTRCERYNQNAQATIFLRKQLA